MTVTAVTTGTVRLHRRLNMRADRKNTGGMGEKREVSSTDTSIVELAAQLGHSPSMTLNTYAHVIAELRGFPEEPTRGLEPRTPSLRVKCSTS